MLTPASNLNPGSPMNTVKVAIEKTIHELIDQGMPTDQAVALAYHQAEQSTGTLIPGTPRPTTSTKDNSFLDAMNREMEAQSAAQRQVTSGGEGQPSQGGGAPKD